MQGLQYYVVDHSTRTKKNNYPRIICSESASRKEDNEKVQSDQYLDYNIVQP